MFIFLSNKTKTTEDSNECWISALVIIQANNRSIPGTLFIMFIHHPVEAKVKEEEKRSAVSAVSFLFCAYETLRIPHMIHPNCSMGH